MNKDILNLIVSPHMIFILTPDELRNISNSLFVIDKYLIDFQKI